MISISYSRIRHFSWTHIATALLGLGQSRLGRVGSVDDLSDYLRRDLGLLEVGSRPIDDRDPRW